MYKQKNSPYYYADYVTFEGKRRRVSLGTADRKEAKALFMMVLAANRMAASKRLCGGRANALLDDAEYFRCCRIAFNKYWPSVRQVFYKKRRWLSPFDPDIKRACNNDKRTVHLVMSEAEFSQSLVHGREENFSLYRLRELELPRDSGKRLIKVLAAASELGRVKQAA
jgi:hypothetical protein